MTGTVSDPSGAVVPNATVDATNDSNQQKYTTTTTGKGVYFIPYMLPGTYTVTATAPGFKTQKQPDVLLQASQSRGLNFTLEVGAATQTVEVTSAAPLIETANGSGGTVLTEREIENAPLNGRQIYTLLGTTPGSQFTQTQFGAQGYSGTRGLGCFELLYAGRRGAGIPAIYSRRRQHHHAGARVTRNLGNGSKRGCPAGGQCHDHHL